MSEAGYGGSLYTFPIYAPCMVYLPLLCWLKFMVNVIKHSIPGAYGFYKYRGYVTPATLSIFWPFFGGENKNNSIYKWLGATGL